MDTSLDLEKLREFQRLAAENGRTNVVIPIETFAAMCDRIADARPLDGKFSIVGNQIVKKSNNEAIPPDEPLFLLRARDRLAVPILRIYEQLSIVDRCNDYHFNALNGSIQIFEKFAKEHPNRMKQPSVTRGK